MADKIISSLGVKNWREDRLPDLTGKLYVITGGNSGIGFEAARMLGEKGADLILACRSPQKAEAAKASLNKTVSTQIDLVTLDLSDTASVRQGAEAVRKLVADRETGIDALINNAGIMQTPQMKTADGFEFQLGTNHLGHFLWTSLLIDLVEKAEGRVVQVSSIAHKFGRLHVDDLMLEKGYTPSKAYGQSKLANLMFAFELDRRLQDSNRKIKAIACHPGYSATNLQSTGPTGFLNGLYKFTNALMAQPQMLGAVPTILAAAGIEAKSGAYYGPTSLFDMRGPVTDSGVADHALNRENWLILWDKSEELLGIKFAI